MCASRVCLGDDGCSGDAGGKSVPADDAALRDGASRYPARVDQQVVRREGQAVDGAPHCEQAGVINVVEIDFPHFRPPQRPGDGVPLDAGCQILSPFFAGNLLRVVQTAKPVIPGENHRRGDYRTGQGADPRLVHAGNQLHSLLPELTLETKQ